MEELQVIETTSGRQFKPWASKEDVQAIKQETVQAVVQAVQDPASITAITSEIASGKQAIASAINAKGGGASATESFSELAEAVEAIPNYSDMVKLAGIIAGGNYDKNALQGHNENVKYLKTEIIDNVGAFEVINVQCCFQYWDLLRMVTMNSLTTISGASMFRGCTSLQHVTLPSLTTISGGNAFNGCTSLQNVTLSSLTTISGSSVFNGCTSLQNVTLSSLTTISSSSAFLNCTSLQNVTLSSLTTISGIFFFQNCSSLKNVTLGTLTSTSEPFFDAKPNLRNITIGQDTNINLPFQNWTATNVIAEGQSGIDELNANLQTNLISKLYQGGGKILRLGAALYDVTTQETRDMVTSKGWTLQRG